MPVLRYTAALHRFFPDLSSGAETRGATIAEVVQNADQQHPGLRRYLLEDDGSLRKHVNIFHNGVLIRDRQKLSDAVADSDEVYIIQALSGG